MEASINKLFEYFDTLFFEERVEVDEWGKYGTHYQGLFLDTYLAYSVFGIDYLSIEDYFETVAGVKYCETDSLYYQYGEESIETRLKVISAILTLINASSHNTNNKQAILNKSKAFLKRFGLELEEEGELLKIKNEYKLFEGSYCDIYLFNELLYKKQLKGQYRTQET